jgi:hypothetical protein
MGFVVFAHLMGFALWIGGSLAAMALAIAGRDESPAVRVGMYRLLAKVHTMVIGVGAMLVVGTGLLLTMRLSQGGAGDLMEQPRLWVMQGAGLLGGALVLFVGLPTAVKLGGMAVVDDAGHTPPAFEVFRRRQAIVSSVAGVFALIALAAWKLL